MRHSPGGWQRGDAVLLATAPEASLEAEAALVRFLWKAAPVLSLAHDVGSGGLEQALAEAAAWSGGLEADVELPALDPDLGAAVLACAPGDVARLGSRGFVQIGTVVLSLMCGVFGVYAPDRDVARLSYFGLFALQHRGQESAGIAVSDEGRLTALRDLGLVTQVFDEQKLHGLRGQVAIGHTRYSTTGSSQWSNAQPLVQHGSARTVALGHNGNLVNATELRAELAAEGITLRSTSDSELIAALIANDAAPLERGGRERDAAARGRVLDRRALRGAARRVPRPARLPAARARPGASRGRRRTGSSPRRPARSTSSAPSSCARSRRARSSSWTGTGCARCRPLELADGGALCIFEFFYLARPDTTLDGVEVHGARVRMGERLAAEAPVDADLVLPIPDSGTPAAIGFARALGIPFSEGLIKNRYVGRTFIQPDQEMRQQGARLKYHPLAEVAGKRIVAVDDSIVRGNTTRQIVRMLFDAGAAEVHIRVSSPPVIGQCFYGIDLADPAEMVAAGKTIEEVREQIGATSLAYLSHDGLVAATRRPASSLCRACLTGEYPTALPTEQAKLRFEPVGG